MYKVSSIQNERCAETASGRVRGGVKGWEKSGWLEVGKRGGVKGWEKRGWLEVGKKGGRVKGWVKGR
jgi:hypothetical protein